MRLGKVALAVGLAFTGLAAYVGYKVWKGFQVGGIGRPLWNFAANGFRAADQLLFEPEVQKMLRDCQITTTPLFLRDCKTDRERLAFCQQQAFVLCAHNKKMREWLNFDVNTISQAQVQAKFYEYEDIDAQGYVQFDENIRQYLPSHRMLQTAKGSSV